MCHHTPTCPHTTIYVSSYYCIFVLILVYACPHTAINVISLLYMCSDTPIYKCVLMCVKRPANAYVWHTWVLRKVRDVCAVVQFGKLDVNHLSMMLSLVSRDPALWRGEGT